MKAPWFPFYCADFLASSDVQLMEAAEVGAYVLLLVHSWQSDTPGYLPNDEGRLRRLSRLSVEAWRESGNLLLGKWPVASDPAMRYNPRLRQEAQKQAQLRDLKAEAGKKSAARRATQRQQTGNTTSTDGQQTGNRRATDGQHTVNTISTPVKSISTGVAKNGNYSQSQSQPSKEGRKEADQPTTEFEKKGAAKGYPDQANVFTRAGFKAYTTKMGFGHIDRGFYLPEIQRKAELTQQERDETGWENYISKFLQGELRDQRLVTAELGAERPLIAPMPNDPLDLWGFNDTPEQRAQRLANQQ